MSVQYVGGGGGFLGGLGTLAQIGGLVTGTPFLTVLGTGMNAADGLINGGGGANSVSSGITAYQDLKDAITGWKNPATNADAKSRKGK